MTKNMKLYLYLIAIFLLCSQGNGFAETMYVTDRLYLSLRSGPSTGQPSLGLLRSDTRVEVLETEGKWAKVTAENGRTGWVMQRYLIKDVPKSVVIEQLKAELEESKAVPERLRNENASLKKEIDALKDQIIQQKTRLEVTTKENTLKTLKQIYVTGIVALVAGLIVGYLLRSLVKKPKRSLY